MSIIKVFDQYLCKGLENVPVLREGNVNKEEYSEFQYSPENIQGPGCDIDPSEVTLPGCSCNAHSCLRESCSCLQTYGQTCRQTYDSHGRLQDQGDTETGYCRPVFECNALCGCSEACCNRVVQRGLGLKLCVYPTEDRGWGMRALEPIPCGTFVCEYAGEVIGFEEARRRQLAQGLEDNNYIIAVREYAGQGPVSETFVDPTVVGNVGRFLNHSCQPNLFMVPVRVHSLVPRLALFAGRDITPQEELTFDYSGGYSNTPSVERLVQSDPGTEASETGTLQRKPCHCGAQNCSQYLPLDLSVLNN
ncbi:histone-lysine N-methyltransferase SETMAR [Oncorhynchus nerka]|uniref:histone-lysine N-methyltransferase SETMAR n=1 Tax=Oncorhynchus nerka TaxID=8023 RepID=UPI0011322C9A|nr:histone-lysine N-methyltransferase SETMAR-like [Oncorhynchus nerka]